jgi:signal transduction histidine kinase
VGLLSLAIRPIDNPKVHVHLFPARSDASALRHAESQARRPSPTPPPLQARSSIPCRGEDQRAAPIPDRETEADEELRGVTGWLAVLAWALGASALHVRGRRRLAQVARARHEVRGPLCAAQLALDGLERSARVEAIALELQRAALALEDLSGSQWETVTAVDVGRLLSDAAPAWRALAAAHGVRLVVEPSAARVRGDRLRLAQACGNLVANAIEHGRPRDEGVAAPPRLVEVRTSAVAGRVLVEVRDDGLGLPAPLAELVAAARGRRSPRGHGLAIAAAVAERHGGRPVSFPADRGAHLVLDLPEAA